MIPTPRTILAAAPIIYRREHGVHAASAELLKKFAAALVTRRIQLEISRKALAARVHISYGQLAHIENAENWPTLPVYIALVRALRCGKIPLL